MAVLPPSLRNLANLLTRSWGEKEQSFLAKIPIGEAIIINQFHRDRSILYMMAMANKVIPLNYRTERNCRLSYFVITCFP